MSGKTSEQLLLYKVQVGHDTESYAELYDMYIEQIYRFVFFKVGNREDAEDISSEIFLKTWNYLQEGKSVKSFSGLLYRMARNAIIDLYRKRSVRGGEQTILEEVEYGDAGAWQEVADQKIDAQRILANLKKLKQEYQEVLTLRYIDELSIEEIAEIVGKNSIAIRVTIHRAQKKLKEIHEKNSPEETST